METTTKITTASVRVALSSNYDTFEVAMTIQNEGGISQDEILDTRFKCQKQAYEALTDYKKPLTTDMKIALRNAQNQLDKIKEVAELKKELKDNVPANEAERIAKLPAYQPKVKPIKKVKK